MIYLSEILLYFEADKPGQYERARFFFFYLQVYIDKSPVITLNFTLQKFLLIFTTLADIISAVVVIHSTSPQFLCVRLDFPQPTDPSHCDWTSLTYLQVVFSFINKRTACYK